MRNHLNYFGLFLVMALFTASCTIEDRTPLTVKGEDNISFRDGKVVNVLLSPQGLKGFYAEIQLKIDGPYVQVVGSAKGMAPETIYFLVFSDAPECGGQSTKEPIIISKIESNATGFGSIDEFLKVSMEQVLSISIVEANEQDPELGELRSCGKI